MQITCTKTNIYYFVTKSFITTINHAKVLTNLFQKKNIVWIYKKYLKMLWSKEINA